MFRIPRYPALSKREEGEHVDVGPWLYYYGWLVETF